MIDETFLTSNRELSNELSAPLLRRVTINQQWADALARNLKKNRMTRAQFATLMGVSEACVYKWLAGGSVTFDSMARAAEVLKVHPSRLVGACAANRSAIDTWHGRAA